MTSDNLTIRDAQNYQPWEVPYSQEVQNSSVKHILGSHAVLHAAKSLGKMAAVFENLDHTNKDPSGEQLEVLAAMAADLVTIGLRIGNLYTLDIATALVYRVQEKNGVNLLERIEEAEVVVP